MSHKASARGDFSVSAMGMSMADKDDDDGDDGDSPVDDEVMYGGGSNDHVIRSGGRVLGVVPGGVVTREDGSTRAEAYIAKVCLLYVYMNSCLYLRPSSSLLTPHMVTADLPRVHTITHKNNARHRQRVRLVRCLSSDPAVRRSGGSRCCLRLLLLPTTAKRKPRRT